MRLLGKDLATALIAVVVLTVILGVGYPLVVTGVAQVAFPGKADGSLIAEGGKVIGSRLVARPYVIDTGRKDAAGKPVTRPDPRYFQARPSQTDYSASASAFSNRGPNSAKARFFYRDQLAAYLALNRPYDPALTSAGVPVDAVTTSASGIDPQISQANARIQSRRVAAVRHVPLARVLALVDRHTDGRALGVFGEPGVNVSTLDVALDQELR
jgi:K+-transporting ATPase ATPase C chain